MWDVSDEELLEHCTQPLELDDMVACIKQAVKNGVSFGNEECYLPPQEKKRLLVAIIRVVSIRLHLAHEAVPEHLKKCDGYEGKLHFSEVLSYAVYLLANILSIYDDDNDREIYDLYRGDGLVWNFLPKIWVECIYHLYMGNALFFDYADWDKVLIKQEIAKGRIVYDGYYPATTALEHFAQQSDFWTKDEVTELCQLLTVKFSITGLNACDTHLFKQVQRYQLSFDIEL